MKNLFAIIILLIFCHSGNAQTTPLTAGTIGLAQQICYNTAPVKLYQLTTPSGGSGSYKYQWQNSSNNSTWSNITGATLSSYSPPALKSNKYYRLRVTSGTSGTVSTKSVLIKVYANLTSGSIGTARSICYNTIPAPLTQVTAPTGGTGTYTYQWQSSQDKTNWINIAGATSPGYNPVALTTTTYFRRNVTSGSCGTVNSASIQITVLPQITLAQLRDNITINSNTSANINVAVTGGTSPYTINYTRNGVAQTAVNSYISGTNIPTGILTTGVYNYVLTSVIDAKGCSAQSLGTAISVTVSDNADLTAGTIGAAQSICYNTVPAQLTQITAPTGGIGTYTFQWQSSVNNSVWTNIAGATLSGYSPPALTASTYFRRTVSSGSYTPANSPSVLITMSPQITLAQLRDNITINSNTSTNINVAVTGGTSPYTINYTRNAVAQTTVNNYISGTNIPTGMLTTGVYNYALTSVTDSRGCAAQNLGTGISVTVTDKPVSLYVPVDSLFRTQTPDYSSNDSRYELGSEFQTLSAGFITKVRLFSNINEGGDHIIRLWMLNGSTYTLAAGPFTWNFTAGIHGWRSYSLSSPVAVEANKTYIISISNGTDMNYEKSEDFLSSVNSLYVRYTRGVYSAALGAVPTNSYANSCYFRDVVFSITNANGNLTAGTIGVAQSICYNTAPAQLTQITAPTGGTGTYIFQWQSSANNSVWTNIAGATNSGYSPPALTASTYFRRTVSSDSNTPANSTSILITVYPRITLAQLRDNITINSNTSTNINVAVTGGTSPFTINYTRNGVAQAAVNSYTSGTNIPTGVLTTGVYNYTLTSVTDTRGCAAQNLGTGISVTVTDKPVSLYVPVDSLFRTQTPDYSSNDSRYELGSEFQTLSAGFITKVRLFSNINEGGDHIIRLWMLNGSTYTLAAGPYTWTFTAGIHGWRSYSLSSPVAVEANKTYIISISNGTDMNYEKSEDFLSSANSSYVRYTRGVYSTAIGAVPTNTYANSCYFRDVVFSITNANGNLTAGTIGAVQSVCYNTVPAQLTQITAPTGGSGTYTFQWQSSANNSVWTNIAGATLSGYTPPSLTESTYFRRTVSSGTYTPANSTPVLITVSLQITLAQLHDNSTIFTNTSTSFNVAVTGGTTPFAINYSRNGIVQSAINNYSSGTNISTGVLTNGVYEYVLTSVTDASGCPALSLGTGISVNVSENQDIVINSNKALVLVNSASSYYSDYINYINPYLENFGIPYDLVNINSTQVPDFSDYAVIIFGHKNVYNTGYPIAQLEASVSGGAGLYSFDPHLFDFQSGFNTIITQNSVSSNQISITNTTHYITQLHAPDTYNPSNNLVNLLESFTVVQSSRLTGGVDLATMSSNGNNVALLQVANYGNGKIVKWCGYDWVFENILGPVYGMDDLIWRGIVWAARKPFVMQGLPPMITMRVDDVQGNGGNILNNFEWITITNEFGIIPWCGTFNRNIPTSYIPTLKSLIDNNKVTASPHGYGSDAEFIYFNHYGESPFDPVANARLAKEFYDKNGLKISKYFIPHYYEISSSALPEIKVMGGEFIGIHMSPDNTYYNNTRWIHCAPYRLTNDGPASNETWPVYYAGYVNFNGIVFFNCLTEIRDDGTYEWYPDNNVTTTSARGIRHLRRALNSMVLPSLFTHEYFFDAITSASFREILRQITTSVSGYNPEYTSTDYAVQYIRAKTNIRITNIREMLTNIEISYVGNNDLDTKCYLFTEQNGQIIYRFVGLPQINGSNTVNVLK